MGHEAPTLVSKSIKRSNFSWQDNLPLALKGLKKEGAVYLQSITIYENSIMQVVISQTVTVPEVKVYTVIILLMKISRSQ